VSRTRLTVRSFLWSLVSLGQSVEPLRPSFDPLPQLELLPCNSESPIDQSQI
jgi:hypothetical protein